MATIDIVRAHSLSTAAAKKKAEELAKTLVQHGLVYKWAGNTCKLSAPGGMAAGATGELPFMLSFAKPIVEKKINETLNSMDLG
jgi:putative polyhydroxyalkanoate system protein